MRLTVERDGLVKALRAVTAAAAKSASLDVLQCVLMEVTDGGLRLAATNLEVAIERTLAADVVAGGAVAVPARLLSDLAGALPDDEVTFTMDEATMVMTVTCGRFRSTIKSMAATEFPQIHLGTPLGLAVLDAGVFQTMVAQTVIAAARDTSRPVLTGVLLRLEGTRVTMVAADGYRLSVRWAEQVGDSQERVDLVVPRAALDMAARNVDAPMVVISKVDGRGQVVFDVGKTKVVSMLVEGKYPEYEQIIPAASAVRVGVDREALRRAAQVGLLFARDAADIVRLTLNGSGGLLVEGESQERGDNSVVIPVSGMGEKTLQVAFNGRYLVDLLGVVESETVMIGLEAASAPGVFEPMGEDFKHVIMPMHLNK